MWLFSFFHQETVHTVSSPVSLIPFEKKCSVTTDKDRPFRSYSYRRACASPESALENTHIAKDNDYDTLFMFFRLISIHFHSESNPFKVKRD